MYFDKPYKRQEFLNLLQTKMFPTFTRNEQHLDFWKTTAYFVKDGIYQLWTVDLDQKIYVLEVEQKSSNDPRITLTKDAFKILEYHWIDHAIIIFHCKDTSSYRLSLLTVSYENWEKTTSSYKRFSYILWPNEKVKTPERELLHPIKDYEDLRNRFKVEVVRDQFFDEYLELFVRLYKAIQNDKPFVELIEAQNVDVVSFTKNLLWKIIFLYFIQQKWWLWLWRNTTTKYGEWNKNFMRIMWDNFKKWESMSTEKTWYFYNDYLEWLFFAWLNIDRRDNDDWFPNLQMKVPYLNWWLFKEEYTWWESYVTKIDNNIFSNYDEKWDDADWILDIFDRYNFTIDEDSLYDRDIAVDPEMLGRIFEKMISISSDNIKDVVEIYDNKTKNSKIDFWKELNKRLWAFYTPREIVHYMTKECLITYLHNYTNESVESIEKLMELKESFLLDKDTLDNTWFTDQFINKIDNALKNIKVLDPAVWSWAFPMWLLHEISSLRYYIYWAFSKNFWTNIEYKNDNWKISMYKIKKDIILNNIYWIDIDPWAIDIAKLRFWLSLVVDEQNPEPLPNFEFKFVCANSLIPLSSSWNKDLFAVKDEPKLETLKKYKRDYYNATTKQAKKDIKNKILEYTKIEKWLFSNPTLRETQIAEFWANFDNPKHSHSFFDPSLMLSERRNFDIIIGNPPYLEFSEIKDKDPNFSFYKEYYGVDYKFNLYSMFTLLNKYFLKEFWVLSYIIPNSFSKEKYNHKTRKDYVFNRKIEKIVDFSEDSKVFDNVSNDWYIVYIISNFYKKDNIIQIDTYKNKRFFYSQSIPQNVFKESYQNQFNISKKSLLISKIETWCVNLWDISFTRVWLTASKLYKQKYWDEYKPCNINNEYNFIKYNKPDEGIPYKYKILEWDKKIVWDRDILYSDKVCPWEKEDYLYEKIILRNRWNIIMAAYSKWWLFYNDLFNWITLKHHYNSDRQFSDEEKSLSKKFNIKYILWILNSKLMEFYLLNKFNTRDIKSPMINIFPIKALWENEQNHIVNLVDNIIKTCEMFNSTRSDQLKYENEIDSIVYQLYWLTDEEIQIVEDSVK